MKLRLTQNPADPSEVGISISFNDKPVTFCTVPAIVFDRDDEISDELEKEGWVECKLEIDND